MIRTIDTSERVFYVTTSTGKSAFCNLKDLNSTIEGLETNEGYFKIFHFWNGRQKRATKKDIKGLFEGHRIKQNFYY